MGKLKPCKFYVDGSSTPLTYDQMREMLFNNYQDMVSGVGRGIAKPPKPKAEKPSGETPRRAKRIEANESYQSLLNEYVQEYESVSTEAAKEQAQGYFIDLQRAVDRGEITQDEAFEQAYDFAENLFNEDQAEIRKNPSHPLHKSAFAIMTMQRMAVHAYEMGDMDALTKFNNWLDAVGRAGGTSAALMDASKSLDPLANLLAEISSSQDKELNKTVSSGRKKKTIVNEIQSEINEMNQSAAEEAVESTVVNNVIDSIDEAPPVKEKKVSKKKELEEKRKKAIDRVKKAFASAAAPGPMMAITPERVERIAALKELAMVEIQSGAYTIGEVVASISKQIGNIVSKRFIREAVESEWAELSQMAEKQKREDLTEMVKDAIEGKSTDKIISVLGKAIQMARPDYIKAKAKGKKISEKQAIKEILSNKDEAQTILKAALTVLRNEVLEGKHLDLAGGTKPSNLSQEQWDAARQKRVLLMFDNIVDSILGVAEQRAANEQAMAEMKEQEKLRKQWEKAREKHEKAVEKARQKQESEEARRQAIEAQRLAEAELRAAEAAYEKAKKQRVKDVIKEYYNNPNSAQSLNEYLAERFPDMSMNQINELSQAVENEVNRINKSKDKTKITNLIRELNDGKEDSDLAKAVSKIMSTRGAMSQFGFANALSTYLGYKGVNPVHIQQLQQLMNMASGMMPGTARNSVMRAANNIAAFYAQNNLRILNDVMQEVMVRNILSAPRTLLTGGMSVFLLSAPSLIKSAFIRPAKTLRGVRHAWDNAMKGRSAIRASAKDVFAYHKIPVSREIQTDGKEYDKDRAWTRVREMSWKDISKMWRSDKTKALTYAASKGLINIGLQGKSIGITNFIFDLQTFLDYLNITALRDIYASIDAERVLAAKGIMPGDPKFEKEMADMLGVSSQKQAAIEKQIQDEVADMTANGLSIPKNYEKSRRRELLNENTDSEVLARAHEKAEYEIGMSEPRTVFAAYINSLAKRISTSKDTNNNVLGLAGFAQQRILQPLFLFSRMALVLGEKASRYAPVIGPFISAIPVRMTSVKADGTASAMPIIKRDKDGNIEWTPLTDTREYTARLAASTLLTVAVFIFLAKAYDEEELKDENGKPIPDPENPGKNLTRKVYSIGEYIDFFGSNRKVKQEKRGVEPINSIRIRTGTNPDGTAIYDYWSFGWFPPQLYGALKMLGEQRDNERYYDDQVSLEGQSIDKAYATLKQREDFSAVDIGAEAAISSFNFEFSNVTRIVNQMSRGDSQGVFNTLLISPGKSLVSSKTAEGIEKEIYYMMDKHKLYVDSKADGRMAEFLMKDVWFADPFIQDRKNLESLDPFGNPIDFPSTLKFVPSLFMKDVFYGMAEHEQKHKDDYKVFYDDKGNYDPSVLALPNRYILNEYKSVTGSMIDITDNKNIQREISDGVSKAFGEYIDVSRKFLMSVPYDERSEYIDWIRKSAIVKVVNELPAAEPKDYPSPPKEGKKIPQYLIDAITISIINR